MQTVLFFIGASIITLWGIGHLIPTKNIISGFGELSAENRRIITMEWIAEGIALCFLGVIVFTVVVVMGADHTATRLVTRACALMLLALAGVSFFTGARTSILPMRLCPYIKSVVAIMYTVASTM